MDLREVKLFRHLPQSLLKYYIRHFPINKGKYKLFSLLGQPLSFGQNKRQTTLRQANIQVNCNLKQYLQRHLYFYGSYEDNQCEYWMRIAEKAMVIFDVGANLGLYSLLAAAANPNASIHAFEPTPETFDTLVSNIQLNNLQNIFPNAVGIGKVKGQGFIQECKGTVGDNDMLNFITLDTFNRSDVPTDIDSIDAYCRQKQIKHINLMKIDIEGGEYDALLGAQDLLLNKAIDCIFLELLEWAANRYGHSSTDIKELLFDTGYHIYELSSGGLTAVQSLEIHKGNSNVIAFAPESEFLSAK